MTNQEILDMLQKFKDTAIIDKQEQAYQNWLNSSERPKSIGDDLITNTLKMYPTDELVEMWKRCNANSSKLRLLKNQIATILEERLRV